MSRRVFLHIGLPKTGTSYLQGIVWNHRAALRAAGLLLPGREKRDHLLASLIVREDPGVRRRGPGADRAWEVIRAEVADWTGDALVSHEFFCAATHAQAQRMVESLAPAQVHLVLTAREPLGLFTSSWQESLKNKGTTPMADYGRTVSEDPREVWNWRALDLGLVLERWGPVVPAGRVHVIVSPPSPTMREDLWAHFAAVVGVDPAVATVADAFPNASMGVVEAETLRRVNAALEGFDAAYDRGRWIRTFLADKRLVPRRGERFWPGADQVAECRVRGERAVATLAGAGYHVVGDPAALLVPVELAARRTPDEVTDGEVATVAVDLVARLLHDVRERSASRRRRAPVGPAPVTRPRVGPVTSAASGLRRFAMLVSRSVSRAVTRAESRSPSRPGRP